MGNTLALEPQRFSRQLHGDVVLLYYVIGHSCCGVSANVLSFCLSVCLFFFGEANKIKIKIYLPESFSFLFSRVNKGYYFLNLSGIDNLNKKAKTK